MSTPSDEPTSEAVAADGQEPNRSPSDPRPLPQRRRGPSAIAEASVGASRSDTPDAAAATSPEATEDEPAPPMSAAAAEFAALMAAEPAPPPTASRTRVTAAPDFTAYTRSAPATASGAHSAPTRPRKPLLAGAAVVGALLIAVPFLMTAGDDGDQVPGRARSTGDTLLGDHWTGGDTGAYGTAAPPPGAVSPQASASKATDPASDRPTPDSTSASPGKGAADAAPEAAPSASASRTSTAAGVRIRGQASGRCLDVTDGATAERTPLRIWDCSGAARQLWRFASDGTVRALGMCMDVDGGTRDDGAAIQLVSCNGTGAQQFRLNAAHDLVNVQADKCVDVKDLGTGNGTRLQLWTCTGADNQKWSTA